MIDPNTLVQWQLIDESCDCVYPWFTHPFLEVLKTWDLSDKTVLEYGAGRSTAWWVKKSRQVIAVEANIEWSKKVNEELQKMEIGRDCLVLTRQVNEGEQDPGKVQHYVDAADHLYLNFDIVVVDGILRNECLKKGIELLSERGGIIIADNYDQDYVWISQAAIVLMAPYEQYIFPQPNHTDHEGKCWKTAYFVIPPAGK